MTHSEQRAKLVEMIEHALCFVHGQSPDNREHDEEAEAILAALHGHYTINAFNAGPLAEDLTKPETS